MQVEDRMDSMGEEDRADLEEAEVLEYLCRHQIDGFASSRCLLVVRLHLAVPDTSRQLLDWARQDRDNSMALDMVDNNFEI